VFQSGDFDFMDKVTKSLDPLSPTSRLEDDQADIDESVVEADQGSGRDGDDEDGSGTPTAVVPTPTSSSVNTAGRSSSSIMLLWQLNYMSKLLN